MKLATYKDGSRDGQLVMVSRDLATACYATGIANRLQQALDDWNFYAPQLQDLSDQLNQGRARHAFPFDAKQCMAPLPRAYQRVDGAAYINHIALLRQAQGGDLLPGLEAEPSLAQGCSDNFLGPCDEVVCASEAQGMDFGAELAVICGDVRLGVTAQQALDGIRLVMLANGVSLRQLIPAELAMGLGRVQSRPATTFSPVAVTLDEFQFRGDTAWDKGRVNLTLQCLWNGRQVGRCEAGPEMTFHFGELIAQICRTRNVRAGTVVGSGPVSNQDGRHGFSCIAEKRATEIIQDGRAKTEFMKFGDTVRLEMKGLNGLSLFGAIDQEVVAALTTGAS